MHATTKHALRALGMATAALAAMAPGVAKADGEVWLWSEQRLPLTGSTTAVPRVSLRVFADVRLSGRSEGLAQAFLRVGPLVHVTPWLFVGAHGTVYADRLASGQFAQELRAELEPNLFGRVGPFTFNDRNRLEYRYRTTGERWRYRNQLRVNYAPPGARWIPFVWDELLVDLSGDGVHQNRAEIGLGRMLGDRSRVDVGYLFRSRLEAGQWHHDHILNLSVYVEPIPGW